MISNRRLIEMIGGRAAAGDANPLLSHAAQPSVIRALRRAIVAVGLAGLSAALVVGFGDEVMSAAAEAAVSGGGAHGSGGSSSEDAPVAELAASDAVETTAGKAEAVITDGAVVVDAVAGAELAGLPSAEQVVAGPAAVVVPVPPTTVPPTPTTTVPAPAPPPPPAPDPGSVEAVIAEIFGEHAQPAIGVARCESGLNPSAISRGGGNWGLFQINKVHRGRVEAMGYRWEDVLDARVNTLVAHAIFQEQGWRPWGCRHAAY